MNQRAQELHLALPLRPPAPTGNRAATKALRLGIGEVELAHTLPSVSECNANCRALTVGNLRARHVGDADRLTRHLVPPLTTGNTRSQCDRMADYRYELRRGEEVIATGYFSRDLPLEVGERIALAGRRGIVRTIEPVLGQHELRLVVQLQRE
jgi:hypothetical protein